MMKGNSAALQRRTFDQAVRPRHNDHGVDVSAFRSQDDAEAARSDWVRRKSEFEQQISILNLNIEAASRTRATANQPALNSLMEQKRRLVAEKNKCDAAILAIKQAKARLRDAEQPSFESAFFHMAKEMLAAPVYERILMAAIHRSKGD